MKLTGYYPLIQTDDVAGSAAFYIRHFGFQAVFEADWYVHLKHADDKRVELAFIATGHETVPEIARRATTGLLLDFEVADVDAVHAELAGQGVDIVQALRSEEFGQRHFIVRDPNGNLADIIEPIPPSAAFLAAMEQSDQG